MRCRWCLCLLFVHLGMMFGVSLRLPSVYTVGVLRVGFVVLGVWPVCLANCFGD